MSIGATSLSRIAIAAQPPKPQKPPLRRQAMAKPDTVAQPEPR